MENEWRFLVCFTDMVLYSVQCSAVVETIYIASRFCLKFLNIAPSKILPLKIQQILILLHIETCHIFEENFLVKQLYETV